MMRPLPLPNPDEDPEPVRIPEERGSSFLHVADLQPRLGFAIVVASPSGLTLRWLGS